MKFSPAPPLDHVVAGSSGRGIAVANSGMFSSIEYQGNGNTVVCRVNKA